MYNFDALFGPAFCTNFREKLYSNNENNKNKN